MRIVRLTGLMAVLCSASVAASAANIAYISSSNGYLLAGNGSTASTSNWSGQAPIQGFSGYGQINMSGRCLTGRNGNQPLTWESCRGGDHAQIWALNGGRLNNEGGWCADVSGNRGGAGVPILAWHCSGAVNQHWAPHYAEAAQSFAGRIASAPVRNQFLQTARMAQPGQVISLATGHVVATGGGNVVATGGGNVVATGGGNVVATGGGNVVATGGGN